MVLCARIKDSEPGIFNFPYSMSYYTLELLDLEWTKEGIKDPHISFSSEHWNSLLQNHYDAALNVWIESSNPLKKGWPKTESVKDFYLKFMIQGNKYLFKINCYHVSRLPTLFCVS